MPVFTELLEKGTPREAFQLASTFVVPDRRRAGGDQRLLRPDRAACSCRCSPATSSPPELDELTVGLSQVLFPIVLLLGLNGLLVGILNAYDHFTIPALAPLVWNFVIIGLLVVLRPLLRRRRAALRLRDRRARRHRRAARDALPVLRAPRLPARVAASTCATRASSRCCALMLPVTLSLGAHQLQPVHQLDARARWSPTARRARSTPRSASTCCPQGMFSVAVATVLFPALAPLRRARATSTGLRALDAAPARGRSSCC